jgi:hypothetical protein
MRLPGRDELLEALRAYRRERSDSNFSALLQVAGLEKDFTSPTQH